MYDATNDWHRPTAALVPLVFGLCGRVNRSASTEQ